MRFVAVVLALATSALGYTVLTPNQSQGWTNQGPQQFSWSRVATDRDNFTVVLTNSDRRLMPSDQVLAALVDGGLGNTTLNPPSAGWPSPGPNYRLNIVANVTNLNEILAQSPPFEIELSTVVPSNTRTTAGTIKTGTPAPGEVPEDNTKNGAASVAAPVGLAVLAALGSSLLL